MNTKRKKKEQEKKDQKKKKKERKKERKQQNKLEGLEPSSHGWKARMLTLYQNRYL
jgi:hypothetical protein